MRIVATPEELDARDGWWKWDTVDFDRGGDWEARAKAAEKWLKPAGYVKDEVKRMLRRTIPGRTAKRKSPWHGYKPLSYTLPLPSLAATAKRLAKAELWDDIEPDVHPKWEGGSVGWGRVPCSYVSPTWTGPRAAEEYVKHRREQLGLSLDMDFEPAPDYSEWDAAAELCVA